MASRKLSIKAKKVWAKNFGTEKYGTLSTGQTIHIAAFCDVESQYGWELVRNEAYNPARLEIVKAVTISQEEKDMKKDIRRSAKIEENNIVTKISEDKQKSDQYRRTKYAKRNFKK